MSSKKPIFPGKLGKLRKHNPYLALYESEGATFTNKLAETIIDSEMEKEADINLEMVHLLFDHYNIDATDKDKWFELSYELALEFVPGFQYEKGARGAPKKWTKELLNNLLTSVECYLKKHPDHSAMAACKFWASKNVFPSTNPATIYNNYLKVKKTV